MTCTTRCLRGWCTLLVFIFYLPMVSVVVFVVMKPVSEGKSAAEVASRITTKPVAITFGVIMFVNCVISCVYWYSYRQHQQLQEEFDSDTDDDTSITRLDL
jgi:NADH:ubiquinone oxidoreductase subunit 6 (subunit J)